QFPDAVPLMPGLADEFFAHPTGPLVTIRCSPWHYADRVVLVGDACHAVVPFLGQGMNAAFEDCTVLYNCLVDALGCVGPLPPLSPGGRGEKECRPLSPRGRGERRAARPPSPPTRGPARSTPTR